MKTKLYLNGAWIDGNEDVTDWARIESEKIWK